MANGMLTLLPLSGSPQLFRLFYPRRVHRRRSEATLATT